MMRDITSTPPPGGYGTTQRTGFTASPARAPPIATSASASRSAA
jgi:hypothetical protein